MAVVARGVAYAEEGLVTKCDGSVWRRVVAELERQLSWPVGQLQGRVSDKLREREHQARPDVNLHMLQQQVGVYALGSSAGPVWTTGVSVTGLPLFRFLEVDATC